MFGSCSRENVARWSAIITLMLGTATPATTWAEAPAAHAHPYEGHAFPVCSKPAATGTESFDAHYTVGREAFEHGEHTEALKQFVIAYEADCKRHEILIIISRAYEGDQSYADAARVLELYLARVPDAGSGQAIRDRIAKLREKDREKARARADEEAKARAAEARTRPRPADGGAPSASASPPADTSTSSVAPWIVVGVGGGIFAAGAVTLVAAAVGLPDGCNFGFPSRCDDPKSIPEAEKSRPATYVAVIMMGTGVAAAATGLVWHFVDKPEASSRASSRIRLAPSMSANYTGITLSGAL